MMLRFKCHLNPAGNKRAVKSKDCWFKGIEFRSALRCRFEGVWHCQGYVSTEAKLMAYIAEYHCSCDDAHSTSDISMHKGTKISLTCILPFIWQSLFNDSQIFCRPFWGAADLQRRRPGPRPDSDHGRNAGLHPRSSTATENVYCE